MHTHRAPLICLCCEETSAWSCSAVLRHAPLVPTALSLLLFITQALSRLGLLSDAQLRACVVSDFNPVRVGFKGGDDIWVRDVLNLGVSPAALIAAVRARFEAAGGVLLEQTEFRHADVCDDGVSLTLAPSRSAPADVRDVNRPNALDGRQQQASNQQQQQQQQQHQHQLISNIVPLPHLQLLHEPAVVAATGATPGVKPPQDVQQQQPDISDCHHHAAPAAQPPSVLTTRLLLDCMGECRQTPPPPQHHSVPTATLLATHTQICLPSLIPYLFLHPHPNS
jgi:hypothetical protein